MASIRLKKHHSDDQSRRQLGNRITRGLGYVGLNNLHILDENHREGKEDRRCIANEDGSAGCEKRSRDYCMEVRDRSFLDRFMHEHFFL